MLDNFNICVLFLLFYLMFMIKLNIKSYDFIDLFFGKR